MKRLQIFGATASPYTQKMLALMRYRRIPYDIHWGETKTRLDNLKIEAPKPVLLPVILLENQEKEIVATTDSTPMIRRLEEDYIERSVIPNDPALAFINYLLEDFGDEWITKYMFHYRWHFEEDIDNAGTILPMVEFGPNIPDDALEQFKNAIIERQTERLWVIGSSDITAELIDASFRRFIKLMDDHLSVSKFLFGDKPSSADFAFYGQLTQLIGFDPTPRKIVCDVSKRLVAWVDVMADLSGHDVEKSNWTSLEDSPSTLKEIMKEFGRMYAPALLANAEATKAGNKTWETEIDGSLWKQKTFSYQVKCLTWIRDEFNALSDEDKARVKKYLVGTGCEALLD